MDCCVILLEHVDGDNCHKLHSVLQCLEQLASGASLVVIERLLSGGCISIACVFSGFIGVQLQEHSLSVCVRLHHQSRRVLVL